VTVSHTHSTDTTRSSCSSCAASHTHWYYTRL